MEKKICVITGGNSGIGKEAALQIAEKGHHVVLACRSQKRGRSAQKEIKQITQNENVDLMLVDMSLQHSIKQFTHSFLNTYDHLDVLLHNAAHFDIRQKTVQLTSEGIESVWATNHIGPVFLTSTLLDALKKSKQGRVITVSSKGLIVYPRLRVDIDDPEFKHRKFSVQKAYYQSKLAQVMYTYWLSDQLKDTKITANCIRVTNVKIDTSRYPGMSKLKRGLYQMKSSFSISPKEMAKTYTFLTLSEQVSNTRGGYFDNPKKMVSSSSYSKNPDAIDQVMKLTLTYIQKE